MISKKLLFTAFLLALGFVAQAQSTIINDSTKAIYGSATTLVLTEADVFKGNLTPNRIDTFLTNLHVLRTWYYDSTLQQDLGNVGTAAQPLFWRMPTVLGARLGREAFSRYTPDPTTLEYYDTKSPFTFLNYVQGFLGESIFRAKHTRNVKPNWNIGIGYERVGTERQLAGLGGRQDGLVSHYGLMAFTHYHSPNERYRLMANFIQTSHEQIEIGGIRQDSVSTISDLFDYKDEPVWLIEAASKDKRYSFHATQWYKLLGSGLQLYYTVQAQTQDNYFSDNKLPYDSQGQDKPQTLAFYPRTLRDTAQTKEKTEYRQLENTFGVMGNSRLFVYRAYAKRRDGDYVTSARGMDLVREPFKDREIQFPLYYQDIEKRTIAENFVGGDAQFRLRNDIYMHTDAEVQLGGGDYRLNAQARYKFLTLRQTRTSYSPTLLQKRLISNHFDWTNGFENTAVNQTAAQLETRLGHHLISGEVKFSNIRNYVYFQDSITVAQYAAPTQEQGNTNLLQANLRYRFQYKAFVLDNRAYYNTSSGDDVIRMPEIYLQTQAYFHGPMFKKAILVQAGVEVNYHSAYYADGYMPVTQQFHLQNRFSVSQYPMLNVFLNADIKTVNFFLKASHLNTVIPSAGKGYFTTPYYTANPFSIIFGLNWNFYD